MRVVVMRSGGFAGLTQRSEVDGDSPALARLVRAARTSALPRSRPMPDAYVYEVELDGERYELGETELPPEWRQLIEYVEERGREASA